MTNKREAITIFSLLGLFAIITVLIPSILGFMAKGFASEEIIRKFTIYAVITDAFLIGLASFWVRERIITKGDNIFGDSLFFASPGKFPSWSFFKGWSQFKIFLFFMIIFGFSGLLASQVKETAFTGFEIISQQFTETGSAIFSAFLVPSAENGALALAIAGVAVLLMAIARKKNWSKENYQIFIYLIIPILSGLLGLANHMLRYSNSSQNLSTVFIFWLIIGILTVATGSFLPGWTMHLSNNLFFDMKRYLASEVIFLFSVGIIVVLIGIFIYLYKDDLFGPVRKKKYEI